MTGWLIVLAIWLVGILPTYLYVDKNSKDSKFNKIWYSVFWPCLLIMLGISKLVNKKK